MPLRIIINLSKKVPGPQDYSSTSASCSIESDLAHGQDPTAEAATLYRQAEIAVDRQLGILQTPPVPASSPASTSSPNGSGPAIPRQSSQPRRAPAPISPAQLRYLGQLLERNPGVRDRILAEQHVATIQEISSRAASAIIDQLKTGAQ